MTQEQILKEMASMPTWFLSRENQRPDVRKVRYQIILLRSNGVKIEEIAKQVNRSVERVKQLISVETARYLSTLGHEEPTGPSVREQYLNANIKREVQLALFSKIKSGQVILGLAGPHPSEYVKILPKAKSLHLVDMKQPKDKQYLVKQTSVIAEFERLNSLGGYESPTFVDCDFCKTILTCGIDLMYIYQKIKRSTCIPRYISFTFSHRGITLLETIYWLAENFPELGIDVNNLQRKTIVSGWRFIKRYYSNGKPLNLYSYRDSGEIMLSGLIEINGLKVVKRMKNSNPVQSQIWNDWF